MKEYKEKLEEILNKNKEYQDYTIDYSLVNNENVAIAYASKNDSMVRMVVNLDNYHSTFDDVDDWFFSFDTDFFEDLERNWKIDFISDETHHVLWDFINDYYPNDVDFKNGVQLYLQYCADKGINKEYLTSKGYNYIPDVMQHFNGLGIYQTMNYKGWIVEADDINSDNKKENLVNIYDTKESYEKKKPLETISLNTINLKDNIADYMENNYISNEKTGKTGQLDNGIYVIDVGYRNNEPIALVEKTNKDNSKEYIIAFYYSIKDNKIDWGYGYYYNNDIQKAKDDFDKVLKGGNLEHTFDREQER